MRYLIKYTKESDIKFIAHLDLMRTIQKIIRRADLPVEYSKGFNPHMTLSIAQPLSVGTYSKGEYMDVVFNEEVDESIIVNKMNENAPIGIKILGATKVKVEENKKIPQAMAIIEAAKYIIKIKCSSNVNIKEDLTKMSSMAEWNILKKSKTTEKIVNIKPMVKKFQYKITEDQLVVSALVVCGSKENLSAQLLADFAKENIAKLDKEAFVDIQREEMYAYKGKTLVPLSEFFVD